MNSAGFSKGELRTIKIPVKGMSCASCVLKIERGLSDLNGVKEAKVNFAAETAVVEYNEKVADKSEFAEKIKWVFVKGPLSKLNLKSKNKNIQVVDWEDNLPELFSVSDLVDRKF